MVSQCAAPRRIVWIRITVVGIPNRLPSFNSRTVAPVDVGIQTLSSWQVDFCKNPMECGPPGAVIHGFAVPNPAAVEIEARLHSWKHCRFKTRNISLSFGRGYFTFVA
jgi:hypothetical protein